MCPSKQDRSSGEGGNFVTSFLEGKKMSTPSADMLSGRPSG